MAKKLLCYSDGGGRISINPATFDKLITAVRTAADNNYHLWTWT